MIPFDMARLDSNARADGKAKQPTAARIITLCMVVTKSRYALINYMQLQRYLTVRDKTSDSAAYTLSRFMTRPDVKKEKLPEFLDWSLKTLVHANSITKQYFW